MGFNIGSAITGAISGAASGFLMGGPGGALAGGALGGAAGGFGVGGGPQSVGGITGPGGGAKAGTSAREYYDEAFPGTNPWERLGAGNPIGALGSAAINAKAQQRNTDVMARTQTQNAVLQTSAAVKVAKVNAAGAANVATIHAGPAGRQADAAARVAGSGEEAIVTGRRGATVAERHATVSEKQLVIERGKLLVQAEKLQMEKGKAFRSPEIAALATRAVLTFDRGIKDMKSWEKHLNSGWFKIYLAAGVAAHTIREGSDAVGKVLGARVRGVAARPPMPRKTSVRAVKPRPKPPGGGEKSAPRGYRPPGPDAATKKSREYWMSR